MPTGDWNAIYDGVSIAMFWEELEVWQKSKPHRKLTAPTESCRMTYIIESRNIRSLKFVDGSHFWHSPRSDDLWTITFRIGYGIPMNTISFPQHCARPRTSKAVICLLHVFEERVLLIGTLWYFRKDSSWPPISPYFKDLQLFSAAVHSKVGYFRKFCTNSEAENTNPIRKKQFLNKL
jgi:hypothetical protein